MKSIGMIPARGGSTRFNNKPLALICGKPMVYWVWKHSKEVACFDEVYMVIIGLYRAALQANMTTSMSAILIVTLPYLNQSENRYRGKEITIWSLDIFQEPLICSISAI